MKTKILSSLAKVFPNEEPASNERISYSCLKDERISFQIAYSPDTRFGCFKASVKSDTLGDSVSAFEVRYVPAMCPLPYDRDDFYITDKATIFPDYLTPYDGRQLTIYDNQWRALWIEIVTDENTPAGEHEITIEFTPADMPEWEIDVGVRRTVKLEVIDCVLPKQKTIFTQWFHTDCLMDWYKVPAFSDDYWRITENFMRTAREHSITSLLVPLFTPPLDTAIGSERPTVQLIDVTVEDGKYSFGFDNFRKWIAMSRRCGIEYFELSHLFTQWGAAHAPKVMATVDGEYKRIFGWETDSCSDEYVGFLEAFAEAFIPVIEELEIGDRVFFHISDEPGEKDISMYTKCSEIINRLFGRYNIIDALSDYEFYKLGLLKTPIPCTNHAEHFYNKVDNLWVYTCCSPCDHYYSNRLINMPSQRTRVTGVQLYKYNVKGYLHWGYNFWNSELSLYHVNPFSATESAMRPGDSHVVYPADDGTAWCSTRLKVINDAFQDQRALQLLEDLTSREEAIKLLEDDTAAPITFTDYPHEEDWLIEKREEINKRIKELV